jgi:YegS/Rv2252/BmrU family lipid kinase
MRAAFIVNPIAGRGRGGRIARRLPELLARRGIEGEILTSTRPREASELARRAARTHALVVAVGGDGTANEVLQGIAGTETVLGLVPVGSGNDLALALGIPSDLEEALDAIAAGRVIRIDLGRFDDGWFANSLGLGFEAQVTVESRKIRRLRGFAIYLWAVVKALRALRCPELTVRADDRVLEGRRLLVCVGNGPRVGGGFYLTPEAQNTDGLFDVCLVDAMGRCAVLRTLPRALRGNHLGHPKVTLLRARRLEFSSPEGFPFHVDGEVVDERRRTLRVEIVPRALRVIVPEGRAEGRA